MDENRLNSLSADEAKADEYPSDESLALAELNELEQIKPKKQRFVMKLLFLLLNVIIVTVIFLLERNKSGSVGNLAELIKNTSNGWIYILCAFMLFFVMVLAEAVCFMAMLKKTGGHKRFALSVKTVLIGKYYDLITPFSMGGQPFQMYYLRKNNVDASTAYSAPIIRHAVKLLSVNLVIILAYIFIPSDTALGIRIAAYVGVAFNLTFPVFAAVVAVKKEIGLKIAEFCVKAANKLKLVKNYDETLKKITQSTEEFLKTLKYLGMHKGLFLLISLFSVIEVLALVSVPYFVIKGYGSDVGYLESLVKGMYAMNAAAYVPTPGTAGGAEAYFYGLFGNVLEGGSFFWAVMTWRAVTYYSFILIGSASNIAIVIKSSLKTHSYNAGIKSRISELRSRLGLSADDGAEGVSRRGYTAETDKSGPEPPEENTPESHVGEREEEV